MGTASGLVTESLVELSSQGHQHGQEGLVPLTLTARLMGKLRHGMADDQKPKPRRKADTRLRAAPGCKPTEAPVGTAGWPGKGLGLNLSELLLVA